MPISAENCTNDDVLEALKAHKDRIGQIVLDARPQIKTLKGLSDNLEKTILDPMEATLNRIFASSGLSVQDLIQVGGFQAGATKAELEKAITASGLSIVNGRVIVTKSGDIDVSAVKELHRLVGSMKAIKLLVPELGTCTASDSMVENDFKSRFIIISTYQKISLVPGVGCKADSQVVEEIVVGIDKSIQQVLIENPNLVRADLTLYLFWLGKPEARQNLRTRALAFGLTENEYFDAVLKKSSEVLKVRVIERPSVQICLVDSFFGDDIDSVLTNGLGKTPKVKLTPTPQEILTEIQNSGVLSPSPGRTAPSGLPDYGSSPMLFLSVVDFEKTFGSQNDGSNPCLDASADLSAFFEGLFGAIGAVSEAINSMINEIISGFMGVINRITGMFSVIDGFLLKLLSCLIPPGVSLSLDSGPLADLVDLLQSGLDLFEEFFDLLGQLLNILAPMACIKASLADIANSVTSLVPGLSCILSAFSFDLCLNASVDIGQIEAGLAFDAIRNALNNLKNLLATLFSIGLNFPGNFSAVSCLPVESAILMARLGIRAAIASAGIPL